MARSDGLEHDVDQRLRHGKKNHGKYSKEKKKPNVLMLLMYDQLTVEYLNRNERELRQTD